VGTQDDDEDVTQELPTHPEVLGIHVQFVAMQLAQLGVGGLDVVQVLHGFPKGGQHLLAVGTDLGVARAETHTGLLQAPCRSSGFASLGDSGADAVGLGLPGQGFAAAFLHIDLAPQAGNELLLFGCPVHHGDERGSFADAAEGGTCS
uniref:Uncharacterized protein n=1 Tax=Terrapene triunguis TaxID=2587831 RepID=A0A674J8I1_9SAUR